MARGIETAAAAAKPRTMATLVKAKEAHRSGRLAEAERLFRKVLHTAPADAEALHGLGTVLYQTGAHERALGFLERALRAGGGAGVERNRAAVLAALNRPVDALAALDAAIRKHPGSAPLHYNRGTVLLTLGRNADAEADFAAALAIQPGWVDALKNRAIALTRLARHEDALACCDQALAIAPNLPGAHRHAAHACLMLGDYARGWREYEWRWQDPEASLSRRRFDIPRWTGRQDLSGRTLLLHTEQGFGDTIQFVRFVPLLAGRGARIILETRAPLLPLVRGVPGLDACMTVGEPLPRHDFQTALMSLPAILGTRLEDIPAAPYLHADPVRIADWQQWLGPRRGLRVGLAWSGSPTNTDDKLRSVPLAALAPLADSGVELIAVQTDLRPGDAEVAQGMDLRPVPERLTDFGETAALMHCVDLVISVCSAPAHLAGALGRPLWVMLRFAADWRWMAARADSPWYPTARLFRQPTDGDWASVVATIRAALGALQLGHGTSEA